MSNVSRSAFAKKAEECKRLKKDLYDIVMENDDAVFVKWQKYFQQEEEFKNMLRDITLRIPKNVRQG